eukprot:gene6813-9329_t
MVNGLPLTELKSQILQLGAALDRGQAYNPTSGEYYSKKMAFAKQTILNLVNTYNAEKSSLKSLEDINGEWELVLTTVPHGIFRSSPFFLAIQEAYAAVGESDKARLFFKLHELQTCSWGASKEGLLISEFDTSIFSLTVIPIVGWFKLLPTFGGRVVTVSKATLDTSSNNENIVKLEVDYTTSKPVEGLQGLGEFVWNVKVPVGSIWRLLPWNQGRPANCSIKVKYFDNDFRIMEDSDGELFVYTRPVYKE